MPPRAPKCSLFPYTTLFRSRTLPFVSKHRERSRHGAGNGARSVDARVRDRKSTRLNSSHLGISYAVFCVKKNKIEVGAPCTGDTVGAASKHVGSAATGGRAR